MKREIAEATLYNVTCGRVKGKDLIVTPEMLKNIGFKEIKTRGRCVYYINPDCKYAVAFVVNKDTGEDDIVLIPSWLPEKIEYSSICFNRRKNNDSLVPVVRFEGKNKYLHKVMMEILNGEKSDKEKKYDHINVCRNCCIEENIRLASDLQNSGNMNRTLECAYNQENRIHFSVKLTDAKKIQKLKALGLTVTEKENGKIEIYSQPYSDRNTWFSVMKRAQRIIYGRFLYDILNDFSHEYGIHLLVHSYVLNDITKKEARQFNHDYWESTYTTWNKYIFEYAIAA